MFSVFNSYDTVDSIIKVFSEAIEKLEQVRSKSIGEAVLYQSLADANVEEANRAKTILDNLNKLVGNN